MSGSFPTEVILNGERISVVYMYTLVKAAWKTVVITRALPSLKTGTLPPCSPDAASIHRQPARRGTQQRLRIRPKSTRHAHVCLHSAAYKQNICSYQRGSTCPRLTSFSTQCLHSPSPARSAQTFSHRVQCERGGGTCHTRTALTLLCTQAGRQPTAKLASCSTLLLCPLA